MAPPAFRSLPVAWFEPDSLQADVRPREVWSWAGYDFANSGYTTVVLTAVFNAYFVGVVAGGADWATLAWTLTLATSNLLGIALMPAIGAAADLHASKKRWLFAATVVCVLATAGLAMVGPGDLMLAAVLVVVSNFAFNAGVSLNSAFLPELARPGSLGKVSGWGWAFGYLGGLVTLGLCLAWVLRGQAAGEAAAHVVPPTMLIVAVMYALAAAPMFLFVRERAVAVSDAPLSAVLRESHLRLVGTLRSLPRFRDFAWLALCGVLYQAGIAVVIALAAIYAQQVMGFDTARTMMLILVVNVTAAAGAFAFGYVQDALGHKRALALTIALWIAMVLCASLAVSAPLFWFAANLAGLAMGASQSAGRAMVGVFAPRARLAEFYGFWNVAVWVAAILGPVTYGLVTWLTGNNQRLAILVTGLFFVAGLLALIPVNVGRGQVAAAAADAEGAPLPH
jgi:UMF1 family MFS transporter